MRLKPNIPILLYSNTPFPQTLTLEAMVVDLQ